MVREFLMDNVVMAERSVVMAENVVMRRRILSRWGFSPGLGNFLSCYWRSSFLRLRRRGCHGGADSFSE